MERPAKPAAHRVAGLMRAFALVTILFAAHSRADIGRAVNGIKSAGIGIAVVKRNLFNNNNLNARGGT